MLQSTALLLMFTQSQRGGCSLPCIPFTSLAQADLEAISSLWDTKNSSISSVLTSNSPMFLANLSVFSLVTDSSLSALKPWKAQTRYRHSFLQARYRHPIHTWRTNSLQCLPYLFDSSDVKQLPELFHTHLPIITMASKVFLRNFKSSNHTLINWLNEVCGRVDKWMVSQRFWMKLDCQGYCLPAAAS